MHADMITEAIHGSEAACRGLFELWYPKAYRIAKSICGRRGHAEDAVQEALIRLWRVLPRLKDPGAADRYFYKTVANEARRFHAKDRDLPVEFRADAMAGGERPAEEDRELISALARAVDCLPEKLRSAVRLHYYGGFSEPETSEILGISLSCVKMRLMRGRQKLRASLEQSGYEVTGG